MNIHVEFAIEQ